MAEYSEPDTSTSSSPFRLGDEGNPSLHPGKINPEQANPLVALQTDIFPIICRVVTCRCFGGGPDGGLPVSGHWTTGRADMAPFISYSPGAVASPPFPSALPAFHLPRKGGQYQRERRAWRSRELGGVEGAGGMSHKQAFTLSPAHRAFREALLCKAAPIKGVRGTCPNVQPLLLSESHSCQSTDKQEKAH